MGERGEWSAEVELRVPWWNRIIGSPMSCTEVAKIDGSEFAFCECTPRRWHPAYWLMRLRQALGIESNVTTVLVPGARE